MKTYDTQEDAKKAKQREHGDQVLAVILRNDQQSMMGIFKYGVAINVEEVAQLHRDGFRLIVTTC